MKKITYISLIAGLLVLLSISSCKNWLGGDINVDPTRPGEVTLASLLPPVIERVSASHYSIAFTTSQYTQQTASVFGGGADSWRETSLSGAWSRLYISAMNNAKTMEEQAVAEGSPHYAGIAQMLQALSLGLVADQWGSAPWSEALAASNNLTPGFDSQEDLYKEINSLLDAAIANMNSAESIFKPGSDDIAFGGDMANWAKAANMLKARYAIHLSNKGGAEAANKALAALAAGFADNADDFQLAYNSVNKNPWHLTPALANNTGNLSISLAAGIVNMMNGNLYNVFDPRLPIIADTSGTGATEFKGIVSGSGGGGNTEMSSSTWYQTETAPLLMATYAEQKFIESEANFILGNAADAYTAYTDGITAHMDKIGVDATDRDAYLADANIGVGAANLTIGHIMKEKYIALYLNPEVWTDVRRHNYDTTNIYLGITMPVDNDDKKVPQRALYPSSEQDRNRANALSAQKDYDVKMWRDQ